MELIKRIGRRKNNIGERFSYWGLFLCSYCKRKVERRISGGKRDKSCGCMALEFIRKSSTKHGHCVGYKYEGLYSSWHCMKQRCTNKNRPEYKNYGGRGIKIYSEWLEFDCFKKWALCNGYKKGLEINRINNDKDYEPENVNFVSHAENNQNKRTTKLNWEKVKEIRKRYEEYGERILNISKNYNTHYATISDVVHYRTWIEK